MKIIFGLFFFSAALMAQHGGGSHAGGGSHGSAGTVRSSSGGQKAIPGSPKAGSLKPVAKLPATRSSSANKPQTTTRGSRADVAHFTPGFRPPAPRPGGHWFGGYWRVGILYPGHWYYPGVWYWEPWYGYSYTIGEFKPGFGSSGLKFDLNAIPKGDRKVVENGIVYADELEVGSVRRFLGNRLSLSPGAHEIVVRLADGRELDAKAGVEAGHITHLLLRFGKPDSE